jgi:hypothetical protein
MARRVEEEETAEAENTDYTDSRIAQIRTKGDWLLLRRVKKVPVPSLVEWHDAKMKKQRK